MSETNETAVAPVILPNTLPSNEVLIYDPAKPPTPESDCFGKWNNPNDPACVGDPKDPNSVPCICFEECRIRTEARVEKLRRAMDGETPRRSNARITIEDLLEQCKVEGLTLEKNLEDGVLVGVKYTKGSDDVLYANPDKKGCVIYSIAAIPGVTPVDGWHEKRVTAVEEVKQYAEANK